jgi:hypothetical protein
MKPAVPIIRLPDRVWPGQSIAVVLPRTFYEGQDIQPIHEALLSVIPNSSLVLAPEYTYTPRESPAFPIPLTDHEPHPLTLGERDHYLYELMQANEGAEGTVIPGTFVFRNRNAQANVVYVLEDGMVDHEHAKWSGPSRLTVRGKDAGLVICSEEDQIPREWTGLDLVIKVNHRISGKKGFRALREDGLMIVVDGCYQAVNVFQRHGDDAHKIYAHKCIN